MTKAKLCYQLAILGDVADDDRAVLSATIGNMIDEFGLVVGVDVAVHDAASLPHRDLAVATAAAYFCEGKSSDLEAATALVLASVPLIPTVGPTGDFQQVPEALSASNGLRRRADDPEMIDLASALLECVGLLRRQRRVFVSYRRTEARAAAVQLHDLLSARGFDVFLDTHSIKPGETFQDQLWHRLVDSDIVVMLDTPTYFDSRWTRDEIGRARAKDIQVLRVIWPDHVPTRMTDLSETVYLETADMVGADGPLAEQVVDGIILRVESLRSRSLAARYLAMTGKLRADVEKIGGKVEAVGAHRAISLRLPSSKRIWAYPVVGVPTAETFNDIANKAQRAAQSGTPILVYDEIGIHETWNRHLGWLNEQIAAVSTVEVSKAAWLLAAMDEA